MNILIYKRVLEEANYVIEHNATVRLTAKEFKVGKSTVHKDMSERLKEVDMNLYEQVRIIANNNYEQRAVRGGQALKKKYLDGNKK